MFRDELPNQWHELPYVGFFKVWTKVVGKDSALLFNITGVFLFLFSFAQIIQSYLAGNYITQWLISFFVVIFILVAPLIKIRVKTAKELCRQSDRPICVYQLTDKYNFILGYELFGVCYHFVQIFLHFSSTEIFTFLFFTNNYLLLMSTKYYIFIQNKTWFTRAKEKMKNMSFRRARNNSPAFVGV